MPAQSATRAEPSASPKRDESIAVPAPTATLWDDDLIVARLTAQQSKHARVCAIIQKLGSRIDGMTKDEAAKIIAQSIQDFTAEDFTQLSVKYGIVQCLEPHTRTVDHCVMGSILRYRRARCH
jgi:hypothetical protein